MKKPEKKPETENSEREVPSIAVMGIIAPPPFPFRKKWKNPLSRIGGQIEDPKKPAKHKK